MPPSATAADPGELNLLREWREPLSGRVVRAGAGSVLLHILVIIALFTLPSATVQPPPEPAPDLRKAVHLIAPKFYEPTQKEPNKGKFKRELDVRSALPEVEREPARFRLPAPPSPAPVVQASVPPPRIEPPKIDLPATPPPPLPVAALPAAVAPPDQPKLAFEPVSSGSKRGDPSPNSQIAPPKLSVQETARAAVNQPGPGPTIGDIGDFTILPSPNQSQAPGRVGSNLQLLSDPQGVDFKPYLIQVLSTVRRNWMAVVPESARMGRRGLVLIQFIIDRRGGVPKLVIAEASGTEAFDRAAVAGISASNPFPPLPAGYKGDQIRLQLAFSYNLPTR